MRQISDVRGPRTKAGRLCLRCSLCFLDCTQRAAGPVLVTCTWCLYAVATYFLLRHMVYFRGFVPMKGLKGTLVTVVGLYLVFNIVYHHHQSIVLDPGTTRHLHADVESDGALSGALSGDGWSHCRHCEKPRPPRSHHCHVCRTCVLKMDHHCPFVANCVGHGNYAHFYLFLLHLEAAIVYVVWMCWPAIASEYDPQDMQFQEHRDAVLGFLVLVLSSGVGVGLLLIFHTYLLLTNQTTVEVLLRKLPNRPYDSGLRRNLQSVFGIHNVPLAWVVPGLARPLGNGLWFETRDEAMR